MDNRVLIDNVSALENELKVLRAAQEKFCYLHSGAGRQDISMRPHGCQQGENSARKDGRRGDRHAALLRTRLSRTTTPLSISTTLYKNTKTCGVIEEDKAYGIKKIAEPIGVIGAVIPTTNPTSTAIFKTLIASRRETPSSSPRTRSAKPSAPLPPPRLFLTPRQGRRSRGHHQLDRYSRHLS